MEVCTKDFSSVLFRWFALSGLIQTSLDQVFITTCFKWLLAPQFSDKPMMVTKFVLKIFHLLNKTLTNDDDDDDGGGYENHDLESDDDFLDDHCGLKTLLTLTMIIEDPVDFIETFPANYDGSPNVTMDQVYYRRKMRRG